MTLIAAVGIDTYPVIFGDLLVSGPEQLGPAPNNPPVDEIANAFPPGSEGSIPELNQKVVLLGDHCVVAWAGTAASARPVIEALRAIASKAPLSMSIIDTYLSRLDPAMKDEVSLVGWVREDGDFRQFWYRADIAEGAMFGRISAAGSAGTPFVKLAAQISGGAWNDPGRSLTGLHQALSSMLSATSLLLHAELGSQSDLLRYFGTGYEIATFVGDRFAKVGDISFVFWMADVTEGQIALNGPGFILKQDYAGEFLLLQVLKMHPGDAITEPPAVAESRRVIAPFGGPVDAADAASISWPGMAATFTCHVVLVRSQKGTAVFNRIDYSESRTPSSIRFSSNGDRIRFEVSQQFCEELAQSLRAGFAER